MRAASVASSSPSSTVPPFVYEVHRAARDLDAVRERLPLRVQAGERGQQAGMDVQHALRVGAQEAGREQAHEAGEAHPLDAVLAESGDDRRLVRGSIGEVAPGQAARRQTELAGACDPRRLRHVAHYHRDPRRQLVAIHGRVQRDEVAAAAGEQYADARNGACAVVARASGALRPRHDSTYSTPGSPATTSPSSKPGLPALAKCASTSSRASAATTSTMPTPRLNTRLISSSAMLPASPSSRNSGGTVQLATRMRARHPAGRLRGTLSVSPPPVTCAIACRPGWSSSP